MLSHWRLLLLIIVVVGAVFAIGFKQYPYGRQGVEVAFVSPDSPARDVLQQGDIITQINNVQVADKQDWDSKAPGLSGNITITSNGQRISLGLVDGIGIEVDDIERTNLDFGLDLKGGTRILLSPSENVSTDVVDQLISTLETRANVYGLQEIKFLPIISGDTFLIQVDSAGVQKELVEDLLATQGKFEAKVVKPVSITESTQMQLGQEFVPIEILDEDTISVQGTIVRLNETFTVNGIEFQLVNRTADTLYFLASVYSGEDIELIPMDPQSTSVFQQQGGYGFFFTVVVSLEGAQRFADVTSGIPSILDLQTGERYLQSEILLYLDGQLVSSLRIAESLGGEVFQSPQITGFEVEESDAFAERLRLQTILRSGSLPTRLDIVSASTISPSLGEEFFDTSFYAAILAALIVFAVVFLKYRRLRIAIPLILVSFSEVVIVLGISAVNDTLIWGLILLINMVLISLVWWKRHEVDMLAWAGAILIPLFGMMSWTIDLPAIGGIIAAIGTGIDHQIIIADEALKGRRKEDEETDIRQKIKTAMFIIFGSAATVIAAMLPLIFLGVGVVRGFAITTMVGVFVGLLITRPAYARVVEYMNTRKSMGKPKEAEKPKDMQPSQQQAPAA